MIYNNGLFLTALLMLTTLSCDHNRNTTEWMFTLSGEIASTGNGLFLLRPESHVIACSERPEREVHTLGLEEFVRTFWGPDAPFSEHPPNASFVASGVNRKQTAILTLNRISYAEDGSLLIQYELLEGKEPFAGLAGILVIDAIPTPVNGQIND